MKKVIETRTRKVKKTVTDELTGIRELISKYPTGTFSMVSDTFDLWRMCTKYLPILKDEIMARDGKLVIRPDSGNPVDILCGLEDEIHRFTNADDLQDFLYEIEEYQGEIFEWGGEFYQVNGVTEFIREYGYDNFEPSVKRFNDLIEGGRIGILRKIDNPTPKGPQVKGVIELLWDVFGGTINEQGYKVLDPHIGAIYGDSITIERADEICARLEAKGFASTNVVLGIGSFTYQYNTRDTFGFAMKATYVEVNKPKFDGDFNPEGREIFKDPITDDGTKKSATGLLTVVRNTDGFHLVDKCSWEEEMFGALETIYINGEFDNVTTLADIKSRLK